MISYMRRLYDRVMGASLANPPDWLHGSLGGHRTATGISVSPKRAMEISAVYAAVRILAESVAELPLGVFIMEQNGDRTKARRHRLSRLLGKMPNPQHTAFGMLEMLMANLVLRGRAYAEIVWRGDGRVGELWPIPYDSVRIVWPPGGRGLPVYRVQDSRGVEVAVPSSRMWVIDGMTLNGRDCVSVVTHARESLALALGYEKHGAKLMANGARPSGLLEHPGAMGDETFERFKKSWDAAHSGLDNAGRTVILEDGMSFKPLTMTAEDSQFLESRQFQVDEVARWFRIPLHMLAARESQPRANMEQMALEFVQYSLAPWLRRIEQSIYRDLIVERERDYLFAEFNVDGLLRGDFKTRMAGYAVGRQWGWLSPNDIRRRENENPVEGGDEYIRPMNMDPVGTPAAEVAAKASDREAVLLEATARRMLKREVGTLAKLERKAEDFEASVAEFYAEFAGVLAEALVVSIEDAQRYVDRRLDTLAGSYCLDDWTHTEILEEIHHG